MTNSFTILQHEHEQKTSCGGTSNETVLRSTHLYASIQGITKKIPGPCRSENLSFIHRSKLATWAMCTESNTSCFTLFVIIFFCLVLSCLDFLAALAALYPPWWLTHSVTILNSASQFRPNHTIPYQTIITKPTWPTFLTYLPDSPDLPTH